MKKINALGLFSFLMFLAVALGAFGAHGLKAILSEKLMATWKTGIEYHMIHALAGLIFTVQSKIKVDDILKWGFIGILFFSGNCYLYALTELKLFALLVPLGGVSFLIFWGLIFKRSITLSSL